jgi:hypothetical protein
MKQLDIVTGFFPYWFGPKPNGETGKMRVGLILRVSEDEVYVASGHSNPVHRNHEDALIVPHGGPESLHKPTTFRLSRVHRFPPGELHVIGSLDTGRRGMAGGLRWFIANAADVFASSRAGGKVGA